MDRLPSEREYYDAAKVLGTMGHVYNRLWPERKDDEAPVGPLTSARLYSAFAVARDVLHTHDDQGRELHVTFQADETVSVLDDYSGDFSPMSYVDEANRAGDNSPAYQMLYGAVEKFSIEFDEDQHMALFARVIGGDVDYREIYRVCIAQEGDTAPHRTRLHPTIEPLPAREGYPEPEGARAAEWNRYANLLRYTFESVSERKVTSKEFLEAMIAWRRDGIIDDLDECVTAFNLALNDGSDLLLDATVSGAMGLIDPRMDAVVPIDIVTVHQREVEVIGFVAEEDENTVKCWMYGYDAETSYVVHVPLRLTKEVLLYRPSLRANGSGF